MVKKETKTAKKAEEEEELTWKDFELGCLITEPGSSARFRTGDWRSRRPVFDKTRCNAKCSLCVTYCPEGCIVKDAEGKAEADLYFCKGCGICVEECRRQAIAMEEEK